MENAGDDGLRLDAGDGLTLHLRTRHLRSFAVANRKRRLSLGASLVAVFRGEPTETRSLHVRFEGVFPGYADAAPVRYSAGADDAVAFLSFRGAGVEVARGIYSPAACRGVDFSATGREFLFDVEPVSGIRGRSSSGVRVRTTGQIPLGREVVLFAWEERLGVLGLRPPLPSSVRPLGRMSAVRSQNGWRFSGMSVKKLERKIKQFRFDALPNASYVEIGDGWQGGRGHRFFKAPARNWDAGLPADSTAADSTAAAGAPARQARPAGEAVQKEPSRKSKRSRHVEPLIRDLHEKGFRVGLWIIPHGQSEPAVFEAQPQAFVRDSEDRPVKGAYLGDYVVDPTRAAGRSYLEGLGRRLRASGSDVFRVAGLKEATFFYKQNRGLLADTTKTPLQVVKLVLAAMRRGAGDAVVFAGDWGTPRELAGFLDSVRPEVPSAASVTPLGRQGLAASTWYAGQNLLWGVEALPFVQWSFVGRDTVRTRLQTQVLFAALTGTGVMLDFDTTIPDGAAPLLSELHPAADLRSLDAFTRDKTVPIWVVKSAVEGDPWHDGSRSVVGLINWSDLEPWTARCSPSSVGIRHGGGVVDLLWFDLRREEFVAAGWGGKDSLLLPGESRFLTIATVSGAPRVIAVSGHLLGRELFLDQLDWDRQRKILSGIVSMGERIPTTQANHLEALERRIHIALGGGLKPVRAEADSGTATFSLGGGHLVLTVRSADAKDVPFRLFFEPAGVDPNPPPAIARIATVRADLIEAERRPLVSWRLERSRPAQRELVSRFEVLRNGVVIGKTSATRYLDVDAPLGDSHRYSVRALPDPGSASTPGASLTPALEAVAAERDFVWPDADDAALDDWNPSHHRQTHGEPARDRSATGGPMVVAGEEFARGWGVRAPSRLEFRLDGQYEEFRVRVGVDDAAGFQGSVMFVIEVDGQEIHRSETIRGGAQGARPIGVSVRGGQVLSLIVEDAGDGDEADFADWCEARVVRKEEGGEGEDEERGRGGQG